MARPSRPTTKMMIAAEETPLAAAGSDLQRKGEHISVRHDDKPRAGWPVCTVRLTDGAEALESLPAERVEPECLEVVLARLDGIIRLGSQRSEKALGRSLLLGGRGQRGMDRPWVIEE